MKGNKVNFFLRQQNTISSLLAIHFVHAKLMYNTCCF